jgi:uncharacterized membrane protein YidH (DUF202 family)
MPDRCRSPGFSFFCLLQYLAWPQLLRFCWWYMSKAMAPPGLQRERTALAWRRTSLALVVTTLLVLRAAVRSGELATQLLGGVVAMPSGAFVLVAVRRQIQLDQSTAVAPTPWTMAISATTVSVAALASVAAFVAGIT